MNLDGGWRAAVADDDLRRLFTDPSFADQGWEPIAVPGHWRSVSAFAETDGPLFYRTTFEHPTTLSGQRTWLTFDGLFYQGDVWLDGAYLGDTEGYFMPHTFDVTDHVAARTEHTLAVEVTCAPQTDRTAKRNLTGVFQHWDCLDPEWNPGGIWRPVRLEQTGPVRIRDLRVLCREATTERAVVVLRANLETVEGRTVTVRSSVGAVDHELSQPLAAGENHVEWTVTIEQPQLWWPWALGAQPMHDVVVEVWADDSLSHRRAVRTGLRRIDLRRWICSVNGERLFLKGTNHGPTRMALAEATTEQLAGDVQLAKDAGLDLLRVHAHVSRPELYDAADEAGLLLWQDLPLQWGYARGVRMQAVRQARYAVQVLGHHPSIAIWCGHNEPMALNLEPGGQMGIGVAGAAVAAQVLPTWNKSILDRSIKRALEQSDGTRPVIPHSGVFPHPPQFDGTDSHLYFGWYWGDERDFPRLCASMPRLARFVTEFGAQAVPADAEFCEPSRWPELDWERLGHRHALQKAVFDKYVPPADYATFDDWREATQRYQATVIKHHIETLRRIKYRPTGGFAQFCFADGMPAVTWSVLGHDRQRKLGYDALAAACQPVIVVADRLPATVRPGEELDLDVHVVSDLRRPLDACVVTARVAWTGGEREWRFGGDVGADECVLVGHIRTTVPDAVGPLSLVLELSGSVRATNAYETVVQPNSPTARH
ncbi:MAG: beta-mannosidase [Acidimicrobiaceae bacterium]|jgi:beta-mannosidase